MLNGKAVLSIELAYRIQKVFGLTARELLHRQLDEQLEPFERERWKAL